MRTSDDRPFEATREEGLRRLGKLTWRVTQLGALATVGFATLFARAAPAQTASQAAPAAKAAAATSTPSPARTAARPHGARSRTTPPPHPPLRHLADGRPANGAGRRPAGRAVQRACSVADGADGGADHRGARADHHEHVARRELNAARDLLTAQLAAIDAACSRFRSDSELWRACSANGQPVAVSLLFAEALEVALTAARLTDGDVDPTCGRSLARLGYERDFALARQDTSPVRLPAVLGGGWRTVRLDAARGEVTVPAGVLLDLGATPKALAADRAAAAIAAATGSGVLVNLGGDISVAGRAPEGGWLVGVADDARFDTTTDSVRIRQSVLIKDGGLATSSVLGRSWQRGGITVHHIIAPGTGMPARSCWPVAVAHGLGIGTDRSATWVIALTLACIVSVGAAATWRIVTIGTQ